MMPLNYAEAGQPQIVRKNGGNTEVKKHLEDLGFAVGGESSVISSLGENLERDRRIDSLVQMCEMRNKET